MGIVYWRLILTTLVGIFFGFFIGTSFPALSLTKIYVPTNPRGAEPLSPGIVASQSDFYQHRLWGQPSEVWPGQTKPGLTLSKMTKRRGDRKVHKDTEEKPGWCYDPHLPPCAAFVEIMVRLFSRSLALCVAYDSE